jgi:hypothetical protein
MTFRVGQKVVCVDASGGFRNMLGEVVNTNELTLGAIYTVRWVGIRDTEELGIRVEGIVRGSAPKGYRATNAGDDVPFLATKFRPLVSRKTDISALKALLVPGAKITEDA